MYVNAGAYVGGVVGINNGLVGSINGSAWRPIANKYLTFYLPINVKLFLTGTQGNDIAIGCNNPNDNPPDSPLETYEITYT